MAGLSHRSDPGAPQRPQQPRPLSITPAGLAGTLLVVVAMAVCIRLGFWQLDRLEERRQLNQHIAARLDAPPLENAAALADTAGIFYRTATLHGTFDHQRSIVLPGRSHRGVPGVHLITPLLVTGRSDAVLVNRGWVPSADAATIDVMDFAATTSDSIRGLVMPFPGSAESLAQRGRAVDSDGGFRRVWYAVDGAALRAQYPYALLPSLLQALPDEAALQAGRSSYPARLAPPPLDEGPHLGYALQWFSFALIALIGWVALVLRSRAGPRAAPPLVAALLLLVCAAPARAQLRPIDPLDWRIFDPGVTASAAIGASVLWQQTASLAGTRGRLAELGNYAVAYRSGRIAIALGGTALLRLSDEQTWAPPAGAARPSDGTARQEPGRATAATMMRLSAHDWPVDVVVRFGSVIPTTSDESGLDRDRTDFFALLGARYTRGGLALTMENGVGINGTIVDDYPQSDVWSYNFSASYRTHAAGTPVRGVAVLVGHQDGHAWIVRGNEDLSELRVGLDVGSVRSLRLRYVHGLSDYSPRRGIQIGASLLLHTLR